MKKLNEPSAQKTIKRLKEMGEDTESKLILFDGVCNLCNSSVQFILKRDKKQHFKFGSLQSVFSEAIDYDSLILILEDKVFYKSDAALEIARFLGYPYKLMYVFKFVPLSIRNWFYDIIAKNRYIWFGKRSECYMPTAQLKERFIDGKLG